MLVCYYVRMIKQQHIHKKLRQFIDDIVIYTHKGTVYKVVVRFCELQMKQLNKLNIDNHIMVLNDIPKINIDDDVVKNCTKYDNLTIIYNNHSCNSLVVSGEDKTVSLNV